ncbi:progestin and adipoQ receptor family member 4 [Apteryx mantelli]|uniref:Progestin and adipoQ receptor family member 4 n=1 Tax=Apteryx mantelli TaxID=2696672 RepID=A0ABM4G1G0_9AVES
MAAPGPPRLLERSRVPPHLQFNPFVLGGYRPASSGFGCLRSLFYLHNELGNIYTHGVPLVGFLLLVPGALPRAPPAAVAWLGLGHYVACVAPPLASVVYHVFMSHRAGAGLYRRLLALDLCGVALVNTLGAVPIIYCALPCRPGPCGAALAAYGALCGAALWGAVGAAGRGRRLAAFAGPALFRLAVVGLRGAVGLGARRALAPYARMEALALLGGLVNVARVPERWRPGAFDYWANSHQLMHLLVALGILHLHWGVAADLHWAARHPCPTA